MSRRLPGWPLPFLLFAVYLLNGDFLPIGDAKASTYLPVSLLSEGNLTFTPEEFPFMFVWNYSAPDGVHEVSFNAWDEKSRALYADGRLTVSAPRYYLVPSKREGEYINTFGPGVGLTALPFFAGVSLFTDDLGAQPKLLWYTGKTVAAALVAASAYFVFLTGLTFASRRAALLLAAAYGLGTCVWSISSQALWQHGPVEFFLALGVWLLTRSKRQAARFGSSRM